MADKTNWTFTKDWKEIKRQACTVYIRICWYLRPKTNANYWKRQEHKDRMMFKVDNIDNNAILIARQNAKFIQQYALTTND